MGYILYLIRRIFSLPLSLFTTPGEGIRTAWTESNRNKSLMLGIPSLVVAAIALAAFMYAQFGNKESLEDVYKSRYDRATSELLQIGEELSRKRRAVRVGGDDPNSVQATEEQKVRIKDLTDSQEIFLEKLITLAPDNDTYRFNMAKLANSRGDGAHAMSILNQLAPDNAPGYPAAHLVLAKRFFNSRSSSRAGREVNLELSLNHLNHMLTRDEKNAEAKLLKAQVLSQQGSYSDAYDLFKELFEIDPGFYRQLLQLNELMGTGDRDREVLESALIKFQQSENDESIVEDDRKWTILQRGIAGTMQSLEQYGQLESRLSNQIGLLQAAENGGARRVFLQQLLAETYLQWAAKIGEDAPAYNLLTEPEQMELVELFRKAYKSNSRNPEVLQFIAQLAMSKTPSVAEASKEIYDPFLDENAPAAVLNQLGNAAMVDRNYDNAILYYERARDKQSRNPMILNNLAFSYLVAEDSNAERSLQLINEGLRNLPPGFPKEELASYLHTKGTALKQLNRLQEAISIFERAIQSRPNHADTLRSVVECYDGLGLPPPEQYITRLQQVLDSEQFATPGN